MNSEPEEQHGIIWQPLPGKSGNEQLYLPYFLESERWRALTNGGVKTHERDILFGILLGYSMEPFGLDMESIRPHLASALSDLSRGFGQPSVEATILSASANLRERFGSQASLRVLRNGVRLLPKSSRIRSDLIMDLSVVGEKATPLGEVSVAREMLQVANGIRWEEIMPQVRQPLQSIVTLAAQTVADRSAPSHLASPLQDVGFRLSVAVKFPDS